MGHQPSAGSGPCASRQLAYMATPARPATVPAANEVCTMVRRLSIASLQAGHLPSLARELEDMHAGVGAVDDVDQAARVGLHVVGLDRDLAAVLAVDFDAALVGLVGDGRD